MTQSLPFGINHVISDFLIGTGSVNGTLGLRHQRVELTALYIGKYLLPLFCRIMLGLFHHLEQ